MPDKVIEIVITGPNNKGKIALGEIIWGILTERGLNVVFPVEGFPSNKERIQYADDSIRNNDLGDAKIVIKTIKYLTK